MIVHFAVMYRELEVSPVALEMRCCNTTKVVGNGIGRNKAFEAARPPQAAHQVVGVVRCPGFEVLDVFEPVRAAMAGSRRDTSPRRSSISGTRTPATSLSPSGRKSHHV
jgi:hypothetical protein